MKEKWKYYQNYLVTDPQYQVIYDQLVNDMKKAVLQASGKLRGSDTQEEPEGSKCRAKHTKNKNPVEWWDQTCSEVVQNRCDSLNVFLWSELISDYIDF